ncbi:MAG: hypothetical protein ACYCX4_03680 [Bacillota bacterium]
MYLVLMMFGGIIAAQVPGMVRQKMWRELIVYSVLLMIGMVYSLGIALDLSLPTPVKGLQLVYDPLAKMILKLLK